MKTPVDLLLLNASNYPLWPIFPYAFVQVSAVARRFGLKVRRLDLLGAPRSEWQGLLTEVLEQVEPRVIGMHIRQVDSIVVEEYIGADGGQCPPTQYFPADDTRMLIELLRRLTRAPLLVGGFGFTVQPRRLFEFLGADLGVAGAPDALFEHFDDLVAGKSLEAIGGLVYRDGGVRENPVIFAPPAPGPEYNEEILGELKAFYAKHGGGVRGRMRRGREAELPLVAIEVSRGCPFSCFFCTEPYVKGTRVQFRELDAVFEDVERVVASGLRRIFFIASELNNTKGNELAFALAERMVRVRERTGVHDLRWTGYLLPTLDPAVLDTLFRSGFHFVGLNDPLSLDDENLKLSKVPYRTRHVVRFFKGIADRALQNSVEENEVAAAERRTLSLFDGHMPLRAPTEDRRLGLNLFLGNAFATPQTIPRTLKALDETRLSQVMESGGSFVATRVYDVLDCGELPADALHHIGRSGPEESKNLVWPTFYFPKFLTDQLGPPARVYEFVSFLSSTLTTISHRFRKNWSRFLSARMTPDALETFLGAWLPRGPWVPRSALTGLPEALELLEKVAAPAGRKEAISQLLQGNGDPMSSGSIAAGIVLAACFKEHLSRLIPILDHLQIPHEDGIVFETEYSIMSRLYARYQSTRALIEDIGARYPDELSRLYVAYLIELNGVDIRPEWGPLLFEAAPHVELKRALP